MKADLFLQNYRFDSKCNNSKKANYEPALDDQNKNLICTIIIYDLSANMTQIKACVVASRFSKGK